MIRRTDVKWSRYAIAGAVSMLLSRRGLKLTAGMVVGWIVLERLVWPLLQMIVFSIAIVALLRTLAAITATVLCGYEA